MRLVSHPEVVLVFSDIVGPRAVIQSVERNIFPQRLLALLDGRARMGAMGFGRNRDRVIPRKGIWRLSLMLEGT
jgi:hypothetical protein